MILSSCCCLLLTFRFLNAGHISKYLLSVTTEAPLTARTISHHPVCVLSPVFTGSVPVCPPPPLGWSVPISALNRLLKTMLSHFSPFSFWITISAAKPLPAEFFHIYVHLITAIIILIPFSGFFYYLISFVTVNTRTCICDPIQIKSLGSRHRKSVASLLTVLRHRRFAIHCFQNILKCAFCFLSALDFKTLLRPGFLPRQKAPPQKQILKSALHRGILPQFRDIFSFST